MSLAVVLSMTILLHCVPLMAVRAFEIHLANSDSSVGCHLGLVLTYVGVATPVEAPLHVASTTLTCRC